MRVCMFVCFRQFKCALVTNFTLFNFKVINHVFYACMKNIFYIQD